MQRMTFENPGLLWLFLVWPCLLAGLGLWGWVRKREVAETFRLSIRRLQTSQAAKYSMAAGLMALLVVAWALPKATFTSAKATKMTGEIALLVDVSASMAARKDLDSPSRLERVKPILYELIDRLEEMGEVKISLHGATSIARSLVPFVGEEDYPYLRESIRKLLDIQSTPGKGSSVGRPLLNLLDKFSKDEPVKLVIFVGDGEVFIAATPGMHEVERGWIEEAVEKAQLEGVTVITLGIGEKEGAKIPVFDTLGNFTGEYSKLQRSDFVTHLQEDVLQEIAARTGGRYFSEQSQDELVAFVEENLSPVETGGVSEEIMDYRYIAHWFVLAALPIWVVFARHHLLK